MVVWSVLFSLGMVGYGSIPPARGSGTDMEQPVSAFSKYRPRVVVDGTWSLAFSKCRPRVVVDRAWSLAFSKCRPRVVVDRTCSLAFSKCRPRVVVDRTWSRLVSHFQSTARAW